MASGALSAGDVKEPTDMFRLAAASILILGAAAVPAHAADGDSNMMVAPRMAMAASSPRTTHASCARLAEPRTLKP
jgi:hypothetical protein